MSEHDHHHPEPAAPETPLDAGSRALEQALRSSFAIVKAVMVILLVVFIFSGMKTVGPQERAVILRFGKPLGAGAEQLLGPGLHWAWPYPIDEVVPIQVGQIQTVTSSAGWFYTPPAVDAMNVKPPPMPTLNPATEGYVLTSDANIIHARATLRYRITDPLAYSFSFLYADKVLQSVLDNALLYAAAHSLVDKALLNDASFREKVFARVNDQINSLKLGITVEPSDVKVVAPGFVQADFDAVVAATQERSQTTLAAEGYATNTIIAAQAEANALINNAMASSNRVVLDVRADANAFASQLPQYQLNPELFRQRRLTETWQRILAAAPDKFFLPERADGNPSELRLLLSREPQKAKSASSP